MIEYEGNVYRPPSEANSLLVQATIGCSYNRCKFCEMYKADKFRIRELEEIFDDLEWARRYYSYVDKIFLCDGDALCLGMEKLLAILAKCRELFPECVSVNVYGNARDVLAKGTENLSKLSENGVRIIYLGAESGSDEVLTFVNKGSDSDDMAKAIRMIEDSGIKASVMLISGLGGKALMREHALKSAELICRCAPSYLSFLTLTLTPRMELYEARRKGEFRQLDTAEVVEELRLFFENLDLPGKIESSIEPGKFRKVNCVFRSNHISNALILRGTLPQDRAALLDKINNCTEYRIPNYGQEMFL